MISTPVSMRFVRFVRLVVVALVLPGTIGLVGSANFADMDVAGLAQFLLAVTVLSLLDVFLPHGDSVDVDAPFIVASLYLFGPGATVLIVVASRVVAHAFRSGTRDLRGLASGLIKRLAAIIAATGILGVFEAVSMPPLGPYLEVFGLGVMFMGVQLVVGQLDLVVERNDSLFRALRGNVALQGSVLAASVSIAILTVVIHDGMGAWGLVVTLFLVATMRQSFALLLDVRQAYQATIETLMGAMEVQSPEEKGLGERTARLARTCGAEFGWFGRQIEHMGYAALLVHYGLYFRRLDDGTDAPVFTPLAEVEFLKPVEPILGIVRDVDDAGTDAKRNDVIAAYLVSRAFGHVQGYTSAATLRIGERLDSKTRHRADRAFERALAKVVAR